MLHASQKGRGMRKSIYTREYATFVATLRAIRHAKGLDQTELARRMKVTQSTFSKYERAEVRLDVIQLRVWCHCVGVSLREFIAELEAALEGRHQQRDLSHRRVRGKR
jgi:transcriptional regulator with XRE-family HTH domain